MDKSGSVALAVVVLFISLVLLAACGGSATKTTNYPTPEKITISPTADVSLELGKYQTFTATAGSGSGTLQTPVEFHSSNTAVLTISSGGRACAGTWDSLTNPQVCTPGGVGVAQVTAVALGVSSQPVNVYVHQHIDKILVSLAPGQSLPASYNGSSHCFSIGQTFNLQAQAFSGTTDITSTVGINFTWQIITSNVATQNTTATGLLPGQAQFKANVPGVTPIFASISSTTSVPMDFETCRVASISLAVNNHSGNSITVPKSTSGTITPTITDSSGTTITGSFLSWNSSEPNVVSITSTGAFSTPLSGGAAVIASCTPPTCNIGFTPSQPVYPESVVDITVTETTSGTPSSGSLLVSSTGSGDNFSIISGPNADSSTIHNCADTDDCKSTIIGIGITTTSNTVGTPGSLPASPDSMAINRQGTKLFLGTDRGLLGTKGLMVADITASSLTVSQSTSVSGKVLAISPDGSKVILSNTSETPNRVFIATIGTDTVNTSVAYPITGATAANFSPDGLKAFIVAGNTLYEYSMQDALRTISPLPNTPATDISFLSLGAFAYVGGGTTNALTAWTNCSGSNVPADTLLLSNVPSFFRTLPNSAQGLAVNSSGIDLFNINTATTADPCSPTASHGAVASYNLGQGNFTPIQLLISSDSRRAYVLASGLASILIFDIVNKTSSAIALVDNASPIQAALSSSGKILYVLASDPTISPDIHVYSRVHVLDTTLGVDTQQISFTDGLCSPSTIYSCRADLIAVKPGN